ncbi:hypothetical protein B6S12_08965, partial [Helicobacter valdiviensis]
YEVHFEKGKNGGNNYLNLDYSKNPSTIAGLLQGNNNNVFIVNPSGVIVEKGGVINANRFVASTTPLDNKDIEAFRASDSASFSPVFKPNKQGDIINRGNINANKVLMIGNNVRIDGGSINGMHNKGSNLKNPSGTTNEELHLVGNNVFINVENIKSNSVIASAYKSGALQQSTTNYVTNKDAITNFNFSTKDYEKVEGNSNNTIGKSEFKKYATMGSAEDWINFANGWNNNTNGMQNFFDEYQLVDNIDMNFESVDPVGLYYGWNDPKSSPFNKNFNGNSYTLSNMLINAGVGEATGLFGYVSGGKISDLKIEGLEFKYKDGFLPGSIGGFAGRIENSSIDSIFLQNIAIQESIKSGQQAGGFAGEIFGTNLKNITLNKVGNISTNYSGGSYQGINGTYAGGFVGWIATSEANNIILNDLGSISVTATSDDATNAAGGFAGRIGDDYTFGIPEGNVSLDNIIINGDTNIKTKGDIWYSFAGGFAGFVSGGNVVMNDIYVYFNKTAEITSGGWGGILIGSLGLRWSNTADKEVNLSLSNINLYYKNDMFNNKNNIATTGGYATITGEENIKYSGITFGDFQTDVENFFKEENSNPQIYKKIDSKGNTYFTFIDETNNGNGGDNGLSNVTLSGDDFDSSIISGILDEVLGGKLQVDINKLFIYNKSSGSITLNTDYLQTLGGEDYQQAISFLKAFYGEDSLGEYLADLEVKEWKDLLDTNNKIVISKNKFLDFLNNNLQTKIKLFEEWKSNYELYTSGLATEEQMKNLESWFKNNEATLKDYQAFLDNPMLTDIGEHNFKLGDGSLSFINGKGYKDLSTPIQQEGGSDQTITSPLKDINASMLDKQQVVLIKPAEEEKETLDEEKGVLNQRTCVVSENFKTNNPCMAQRI